jgi:purine-binding chemotaxis protein CheW
MTDKPQDDDAPQEAVQDYLDMLLSKATDKPEAQIEQRVETKSLEQVKQPTLLGRIEAKRFVHTPLSIVVGGASVKANIEPQSSPKLVPDSHNIRPFAEPVKPLTLKIPAVKKAPKEPEPVPVVKAPPVETKIPVEPPVIEGIVEEPEIAESPVEVEEEVVESVTFEPTQWLESGRPSWAQSRFECLLFTVGGLTLAVPLVELGSIYPLTEEEEVTPIFGQIDWFMGLLSVKGGNIRTVNTAKVVMPERYQQAMAEKFAYVISINGLDWGLAVDTVSTAITLDPDDVRWRSERTSRPWLAGTVVEHMCALLDVSQLALMFAEQDNASGT